MAESLGCGATTVNSVDYFRVLDAVDPLHLGTDTPLPPMNLTDYRSVITDTLAQVTPAQAVLAGVGIGSYIIGEVTPIGNPHE
ncbi:hypothetical protein [Gloeomargarita lithophora]|uniref:hypothetical protein n=1 Tax=Gloeomargarita lithophora TaxID=1188228 RepID=UPI0008F8E108|nr:hypothetical protein [Gloeomargarita lithophora]